MALRRCAFCTRNTGKALRVLSALLLVLGSLLIMFGSGWQDPIRDFPAVATILMGVVALLCGLLGLLTSGGWKGWQWVFLALHGLNTVFNIALLLCLWFNMEGMLQALHPDATAGKNDAAHLQRELIAAKVVLLLFLPLEITAEVLAAMLCWWLKPDDDAAAFNNFDPDVMQERALTMTALRVDVEAGHCAASTHDNAVYNKVRGKMAAKYGELSHGVSWKKEGWWPW